MVLWRLRANGQFSSNFGGVCPILRENRLFRSVLQTGVSSYEKPSSSVLSAASPTRSHRNRTELRDSRVRFRPFSTAPSLLHGSCRMRMDSQPPPFSFTIDQTTLLSLLAALALLVIAYLTSLRVLHPSTSAKIRILFIWHGFDALIHFLFEGSFLYNCFFTYSSIPHTSDYPHPASLTSSAVYFLGYRDRLYGSAYGTSLTAKLWQEYAKADRRWGGAGKAHHGNSMNVRVNLSQILQ